MVLSWTFFNVFLLLKSYFLFLSLNRPRQTNNQVHDEKADHRQVNVQQRARHPELCQFHHQRLHSEVAGHVPGDAEEEKELKREMVLNTSAFYTLCLF